MREIETVCPAGMFPVRAHEHDAGADLRAARGVKFMHRGRKEGRNKIPVEVNGVLYQSQREASRAMRLSDSAVSEIRRRLKPERGETVKVDGFEIRWPE